MADTAISQLKQWLVAEISLRNKELPKIWHERNSVYGFHGGISDEEEDERRYAALDRKYIRAESYISALRATLQQLDSLATHKFREEVKIPLAVVLKQTSAEVEAWPDYAKSIDPFSQGKS